MSCSDQAAKGMWSDASYEAMANWWADQLPGPKSKLLPDEILAADSVPFLETLVIKDVARRGVLTVSPEQRQKFCDSLINGMKEMPQDISSGGLSFVRLTTDYHPCALLDAALNEAEIGGGLLELPWKTETYLFEDGQIFVPSDDGLARLPYAGAPEVPYFDGKDLNFSNCPTFRAEDRFAVMPIAKGQKFYARGRLAFGDKKIKEHDVGYDNQVLCVQLTERTTNVNMSDFLSKENAPINIRPDVRDASCFTEGSDTYGYTIQKTGDMWGYRKLYPTFQLMTVKKTIGFGTGYGYAHLNPGDFILRFKDSSGRQKFQAKTRARLLCDQPRWLPSDEAGTITSEKPFSLRDEMVKRGPKAGSDLKK
jgi:hypothetical protein